MTYSEARAEAQRRANQSGCDFGVERDAFGFHWFGLPRVDNRYGHELRCEVVHPMTGPYQPGHGPETHPACGWVGI